MPELVVMLHMSDGTASTVRFASIGQFYEFAALDSGMYAVTDAEDGSGFFLNPAHVVRATGSSNGRPIESYRRGE